MQIPSPSSAADPAGAALREEIGSCRKAWRRHWERFRLLRYENLRRSPTWRLEEESRAWRTARADVRRYAALRSELADLREPQEFVASTGEHAPT